MARGKIETKSEPNAPGGNLHSAYDAAMNFPVEAANNLRVSPEFLQEKAHEEAAFGRISIDDNGLTPGTRLHIIEPARGVLAAWRQARRQFDVAIEPKMRDINALREVEKEIAAARERTARDERDAEEKWETDQTYLRARNEFRVAEIRYQELKTSHGNRDANMGSHNPLYWLALLGIGVAEWLINYDVFFLFTNVVAIAAGATIIMGVLLAFAAHGHGMIFKQWSYRFGEHREAIDRRGDWRMLSLSTFSLLIVLAAAAGSRYAAVMHQVAAQPAINILPDAQIAFNPMRDVLLSLLLNVMAWAVGVFIAYMAHDKDPDFMDATRQHDRAHRHYSKLRRPIVNRLQQIKAKLIKDIERFEVAARTRAADVHVERELLDQIEAHESSLIQSLAAAVRGNARAYHATLSQLVVSQRGAVTIERIGPRAGEISLTEFRNEPVNVTDSFIKELA